MTKAREQLISLEDTSFYHCYVRCVRRAYLCGEDRVTGQNFDHRKQWIVSRMRFLSYVYAIDICAYAVMSNHYHVVLHVDIARAEGWSMQEVAERWTQLFEGDLLVKRWLKAPKSLDEVSLKLVEKTIETWRERLTCISWFMRNMNETIARMANAEEGVKGRFWEGRFKSQALLDEVALLSCMTYVDLNPLRAAIADDLESSDFTSIQQRISDYAEDQNISVPEKLKDAVDSQTELKEALKLDDLPEAPLMPFAGSLHVDVHTAIPFTYEDYLDLVDTTGRVIRDDKRGFISGDYPKLIDRLGIDSRQWLYHVKKFGQRYGMCCGSAEKIRQYAERFDLKWSKGVGIASGVYRAA